MVVVDHLDGSGDSVAKGSLAASRSQSTAPWWQRARLSEEERASTVEALLVNPTAVTLRRFAVLLCLSVAVAAVGLLQNSVAVVIGAMMIAPLMAPIMGVAASLVMGWGRQLVIGLAVVATSIAVAVVIAWCFAQVLPEAGVKLPSEVLGRTSPDVRDLLVALAAGAAGSFATVRRDVSGALPGVAVAVALVPPLACVGVLLGRGQPDLARGAALLFATNLFCIVLAASVVFLLTGLVPAEHVRVGRRRILATLGVAALPTIAIAAVLTGRFMGTVDHARDLKTATQTTLSWLGTSDDLQHISLDGSTVGVEITGKDKPPPVQALTDLLSAALERSATVNLRWTPLRGDEPAPPRPPLNAVDPIVRSWLAPQSLVLDGLSYTASGLQASVSGPNPPGNTDDLTGLIKKTFPSAPSTSLAWTRQDPRQPDQHAGAEDSQSAAEIARTTANEWSSGQAETVILGVFSSDEAVTVSVGAPNRPDTGALFGQLRTALPTKRVTIQWIQAVVANQTAPAPPSSSPPPR